MLSDKLTAQGSLLWKRTQEVSSSSHEMQVVCEEISF